MRVQIFDETGPLGPALAERLRSEGHDVSLDGGNLSDAEVLVELRQPRSGDVRGAGTLIALFTQVLEHAAEHGTPVVFASSADVYGATDKLPFGVQQPVERHLGTRGAGLRALELLAQAWSQERRVPVTALRLFDLYGPGVDGFVQDVIRAAQTDTPLEVPGGLGARRDFVFLDDVVETFVRAIERAPEAIGDLPPFAAHNVGSGSPTPLSKIVELVEAKIGRTVQRVETPATFELAHSWADVRELQQAYGFRPRTSLGEGIEKTIAATTGHGG